MTLLDILNQVTFKDIQNSLLKYYPDEEDAIADYRKVFLNIFQIQPKKNIDKWKIVVAPYKETFISKEDNEQWTDEGYDIYAKKPKDKNHYAIECTPWEEWLSMNIDNNTLKIMSNADIVAHCLYEMTFISFEQEEIQGVITMVKGLVEEIEETLEKEKINIKEPLNLADIKKRKEEKK